MRRRPPRWSLGQHQVSGHKVVKRDGMLDVTSLDNNGEADLGPTEDSGGSDQDGGGSGANNGGSQSDCTEAGVCDCVDLLPGSCGDLPDCGPIHATTVVMGDDGCERVQREFGCRRTDQGCNNNTSYGSDDKGNCWLFPNGNNSPLCVPERFTTTGDEAERCMMVLEVLCEE